MGADAGKRWWSVLCEAVAGTEQDFTEGSLGRAIALLTILFGVAIGLSKWPQPSRFCSGLRRRPRWVPACSARGGS